MFTTKQHIRNKTQFEIFLSKNTDTIKLQFSSINSML